MKEQGIIIYPDGTTLSYGTYYCPDDPKYHTTPKHEESFKEEIESSLTFKLSNLEYNNDLSFYHNALLFSLEGAIMIINNQLSVNDLTKILAYVPLNPTSEQLTALKENETIKKIEIQNVYGFNTYDFDDYIEYQDFDDYIKSNKIQKD